MTEQNEVVFQLTNELEKELFDRHGPLMTGEHLSKALGYQSLEAFRIAVRRKTVPIPTFPIEKRKGKFALTKDVAFWLAKLRIKSCENNSGLLRT
ncbi:hypothetical protein [Thalassotalea hakodatensis]|uniref:hypothetical protein n=1 Tax=Thalassotalea hakodatensis TaxID=3030492 RepID=UPI002572F79E|nr:hypothetical protein [Thalassotalea hakodatensis]